jgi:hypothetical protein
MAAAGKRSALPVDTRDLKKVKLSSKEIAVGDIVIATVYAGLTMYGIVVHKTHSNDDYRVLMLCETDSASTLGLYYIMRVAVFIPECVKLVKDSEMSKIVVLISETDYFKQQTSKMSVYMRYEFNRISGVTLEYDKMYLPFLNAIQNYNANDDTVIDLTTPTEDDINLLDMSDPANVKMLEVELEKIRKSMLQVAKKKVECKLQIKALEEEIIQSEANTEIKNKEYNKLEPEYFAIKNRFKYAADALSDCKVNDSRISKLITASKQTLEDLNVEYTQDAPLRIAIQLKMITCVTSATSSCKTDMDYSSYAKVIKCDDNSG